MFWNLAMIGSMFLVGFLIDHIVKYRRLRFDNMVLDKQLSEIRNNFGMYRNVTEIQISDLNRRIQVEIVRNADLQKFIMDIPKTACFQDVPVSEDVVEAVRYAMKRSHPDNGGSAEDFIKFQKVHEELMRRWRGE